MLAMRNGVGFGRRDPGLDIAHAVRLDQTAALRNPEPNDGARAYRSSQEPVYHVVDLRQLVGGEFVRTVVRHAALPISEGQGARHRHASAQQRAARAVGTRAIGQ